VALLATAAGSAAPEPAGRRVVIVTPGESDARFVATREAMAFWNQTLQDLQLRTRLIEARIFVDPPITRRLETYTRQVWLLAGRPVSKDAGPKPPQELIDLDGDIVVFFSKQIIFSFAWPFEGGKRYFIGIQTDTAPPLDHPNVARNIIAHELGHVLGLVHNGNTATLMCGPCRHLLYWSELPVFFPLTVMERTALRTLHPAE
jgi:hypothetical protein